MAKPVTAEYDAKRQTLRLAKVQVVVTTDAVDDPGRPWLAFEGKLSREAGEELARTVEELFPPWNE